MASLFITPSSVIKRLREIRDFYIAESEPFPNFGIYGSAELDLIKKDGNKTLPISMYVSASSGSGALLTTAGDYPTEVTSNISIILVIRTEDIRGQQADELGVGFKNFIVKAIHSWDELEIPGNEPLRLTSESPFGVDGHAVYVHSFTFSQIKELHPGCFEDITGTWDDLEWFNSAHISADFITGDGEENTLISIAQPNIPPLSG